jgi:hypothetical protein
MSHEQQAAYIIAQAVCAMAEIAGMQAMDRAWEKQGYSTYNDLDYAAVIEKYGIHHNAVLSLFQGSVR